MPVVEGNSGTRPVTFTITLSRASLQPRTVVYGTGNFTAQAGSDYVGEAGAVTFAPGETSRTIDIDVIGDNVDENN